MNDTKDGFDITGLTYRALTSKTRDEFRNLRIKRENSAKNAILKEEDKKNQRAISCYPKHSRIKLKEYYQNVHCVRLGQRELEIALKPIAHNFEKLE